MSLCIALVYDREGVKDGAEFHTLETFLQILQQMAMGNAGGRRLNMVTIYTIG